MLVLLSWLYNWKPTFFSIPSKIWSMSSSKLQLLLHRYKDKKTSTKFLKMPHAYKNKFTREEKSEILAMENIKQTWIIMHSVKEYKPPTRHKFSPIHNLDNHHQNSTVKIEGKNYKTCKTWKLAREQLNIK